MQEVEILQEKIRSKDEVVERALVLFGVSLIGLNYSKRKTAYAWLERHGLIPSLTELEAIFVNDRKASKRDCICYSWQFERLVVLLWCLGAVESLPAEDSQCDTQGFQSFFLPMSTSSVEEFKERVVLREEDQLFTMQERMEAFHWEARNAKAHSCAPKKPVDLDVIQERHHAINWVVGHLGQDWDSITCDTAIGL